MPNPRVVSDQELAAWTWAKKCVDAGHYADCPGVLYALCPDCACVYAQQQVAIETDKLLTIIDNLHEAEYAAREDLDHRVKQEREACAKIADKFAKVVRIHRDGLFICLAYLTMDPPKLNLVKQKLEQMLMELDAV